MSSSSSSSSFIPALLYFIISFISLYLHYTFTSSIITFGVLMHILFIIVWTIFLYFLCMSNLCNLAWLIFAIPFVFGYFIFKIIFQNAVKDPSILSNIDTKYLEDIIKYPTKIV